MPFHSDQNHFIQENIQHSGKYNGKITRLCVTIIHQGIEKLIYILCSCIVQSGNKICTEQRKKYMREKWLYDAKQTPAKGHILYFPMKHNLVMNYQDVFRS